MMISNATAIDLVMCISQTFIEKDALDFQ